MAVAPAALRALVLDTLALWGLAGGAEWRDGALVVTLAEGRGASVRPAAAADHPARWFLEVPGGPARPPRPNLSVVGLLASLRRALGLPRTRQPLRIGATEGAGTTEDPQPRAGPSRPPEAPPDGATPVLVVTGFLGSGKTTLVAHMIRDPAFARTAVIVNEWGSVGIDHDLLATGRDDLVRLSTGCLCCAVRGDLAQTLLRLDERRRAGEAPFERVVIETSGLADPAPILQELMTDPEVGARFRADGVVTLVDALHGEASLAAHVEARQQVSLADLLILTKTDLVAPGASLRTGLSALNPLARLITVTRGAVSPARLFGAGQRPLVPRLAGPRVTGARLASQHTDGLGCAVMTPSEPMPAAALALLLRALAEQADGRLLRAKGLVQIAERPAQPALVQGVQHVFEPPEWLGRWPEGGVGTRLVLIGTGIPPRWPSRLYDAIVAEVRDEAARQRGVDRAVPAPPSPAALLA